MNRLLIELIVLILSATCLSQSVNETKFSNLVRTLSNSPSNCSDFRSGNEGKRQGPIYVYTSHSIISEIVTHQRLSVFYNETLTIIERFLLFFDYYFSESAKKNFTVNGEKIKFFLRGLRKFDQSLKSVGFCLNDRLYHSYLSKSYDYLCKFNVESFVNNNTLNQGKIINKNIRQIKWEPVLCISDPDSITFPVRIVYSMKTLLSKKPAIIYFEFNILDFKLDQCAFNIHHCRYSTVCIYKQFSKNQLFSTGNYYCRCKKGYFNGQRDMPDGFPGYIVEKEYLKQFQNDHLKSDYFRFNCEHCKLGCENCTTDEPCMVTYEIKLLRGLPLAIQSFCITICIVTGIIIFQLRRTRVVKNSNWILLELFLLGAILIYGTIINAYFPPSEISCAIQPFLREVGFVLMYGVLYVKVYRVLCSFQSRKAQRVYVRDQDILRYLGVFVMICIVHLIAWLATGFDHKQDKQINTFSFEKKLSIESRMLTATICRTKFWEIVSYFYETTLLALTVYNCKCVKSAPSEYGEVRFITVAVINELLISFLVITIRMNIMTTVHPDYIFLMHFIHCHATATISVLLLIGPKMWYLYRPPVTSVCKPRLVPHTESHIIQTQQKLNGDVDLVEINLADMDCETIRDELKRLYTQLEIYKTRAMRKDNPHVSRKRGGRKQRRFSLQHFHKKHHTTSVHDDETSKISEDSAGNSGGEEATLTSTGVK